MFYFKIFNCLILKTIFKFLNLFDFTNKMIILQMFNKISGIYHFYYNKVSSFCQLFR